MKIKTVLKIIALLLILTFLGMFIFENLTPVPIWIPLFRGRQCGLIVIILISYLIGASNIFWFMVHIGAKMKKKRKLSELVEEDEELFEDEA
ncbi:MAG TPA: hypothetical protein DD723_01285 [Candidatus Omnitrophica bacterium]|nr:MAG: hypothetical protein A2Z81_02140 [Omnitrophica WOR_2 bacterium GWA2_45_18]OGX19944.1 MAG: hypothetical protein A2Y04_04185 [Omnitrophica WOR_2 bacterium GWC2_45_7]HBR14164.1 hypothetical protein [Candidatus Omnitrophota bacterium]